MRDEIVETDFWVDDVQWTRERGTGEDEHCWCEDNAEVHASWAGVLQRNLDQFGRRCLEKVCMLFLADILILSLMIWASMVSLQQKTSDI